MNEGSMLLDFPICWYFRSIVKKKQLFYDWHFQPQGMLNRSFKQVAIQSAPVNTHNLQIGIAFSEMEVPQI